ncbi:response regulator transcription factor [Kineococcus endophyticus]|uniref:Response regulator transcription factor n=1 Tax=Kineococcus endophyticus TaxID=1181883 RepID=A0ABV3P6P1_9ACTN
MRVLVVEDDDGVAAAVVDALRTHGHAVLRVPGVGQAREVVRDADLVLLDLGLPDGDGLGLLRELRTRTQVPVLVMTARSAERDVVHALHLGADDYLVKPVRLRELLARINVVTARARRAAEPAGADGPAAGGPVVVGDVVVDLAARRVRVGGSDGPEVELTAKEFDVLAVLARRVGQVVPRQLVMDEVWGEAHVGVNRSLDVHLSALRAKLDRPGVLVTVRGVGFRLGR